jgi:hypothetical protein
VIVLALLLGLPAALQAQPMESWHTTDFAYVRGSKLFMLHTQLRTSSRWSHIYHGRTGPWFQFLHRGVTYGSAYYYQHNHLNGRDPEDSHRSFTWIDFPVHKGSNRVMNRAMYERFFGSSRPAFNRYRYQVRYQREGTWTPLISWEAFLDRHGVFAWRYSAGIRHALNKTSELDAGYFYDQRRMNVGGPRHVLFTNLRFRWGE